MFLLTVRKEIINNVLGFRFAVTYGLLFCLILLAMFLMTEDYQQRMGDYSTQDSRAREQLSELDSMEDAQEQFERLQSAEFIGTAATQAAEPPGTRSRGQPAHHGVLDQSLLHPHE